jgi:hypothetical protein
VTSKISFNFICHWLSVFDPNRSSNGDDFFEEFYRRALQSLSTSEMEVMIAKVLSDAA